MSIFTFNRWLFFTSVILVLAVVTSAHAANTSGATCVISPDPVVLGQPWSITVTGLEPDTTYEVFISQAQTQGNTPTTSLTTDATGSSTLGFTSTDQAGDGPPLGVGSFRIHIQGDERLGSKGAGNVNCKGTVA